MGRQIYYPNSAIRDFIMKILVTGATGFIGQYVVNELMKYDGYNIIATSRTRDKALKMDWWGKVKYIECNLDSDLDYYQFFDSPDMVIHLAWNGLPNYTESFHYEKNLMTNYFFLKKLITSGLNELVIIGTCLEYGMKEGCLSEKTETNPAVPYGLAKDILRRFVENLKTKYDFDFKWVRLFYVYGKHQNKNSLVSQIETAIENEVELFNMSDGEQLRDYLPVEKASEYIVRIALQKKINGIINCCSGQPISVRKFVEEYLKNKNSQIKLNLGYYPHNDYEPFAFWGDNSKLETILKESK